MSGQQLTGSLGRVMDQLVSGARSHRDGAINTIDAVDRQTKAASEQIARTVVEVPPPTVQDRTGEPNVSRDDRFDPEEWNGSEQRRGAAPTPAAAPNTAPAPRARRGDDDEDDYPETWLR